MRHIFEDQKYSANTRIIQVTLKAVPKSTDQILISKFRYQFYVVHESLSAVAFFHFETPDGDDHAILKLTFVHLSTVGKCYNMQLI